MDLCPVGASCGRERAATACVFEGAACCLLGGYAGRTVFEKAAASRLRLPVFSGKVMLDQDCCLISQGESERTFMPNQLGKTLLIANPVAQSGNGASSALFARELFRKHFSDEDFSLVMTESAQHGVELASQAAAYDTVLALGGDGHIHEVANGLMMIGEQERPQLGIVPVGSGNDYARTLGMDFSVEKAVGQLLEAQPTKFDLGLCNGEYFVETLSFGLDAAIALDTVTRREETGKTGTPLFLASGMDVLFHHMEVFGFSAEIDGREARKDQMLLFAVQIGQTYGGGFRICPKAQTDDGLLDLCIAHPPMGIPKAVFIFLLAKNAHHTRFKQLEFLRAKSLTVTFDTQPPAQIDGEPFPANRYEISCVQKALQVLTP